MLLHYAGDPSILCWPADDQQLSKYTLESVLYYLIASSLLYMRCVAVGATLSSLTSLISSHSHRAFNSFLLSQSVHVYTTHCVYNEHGRTSGEIHTFWPANTYNPVFVCVCLVVVRRYLFSLMIWICWFLFVGMRAIVARCTSDAGHPERMRRSMLLYCTQIDGWIEWSSKRRRAGLMRWTPSDLVALYYSCRVYMYTFFFFCPALLLYMQLFFVVVIFKPTTTTWKGSVRRVKRKLNIQRWLLLLPLGSFQRMSAVVLAVDADVNRSPFFLSFLFFLSLSLLLPISQFGDGPCSIEKSASFKQCPHSPSFSL